MSRVRWIATRCSFAVPVDVGPRLDESASIGMLPLRRAPLLRGRTGGTSTTLAVEAGSGGSGSRGGIRDERPGFGGVMIGVRTAFDGGDDEILCKKETLCVNIRIPRHFFFIHGHCDSRPSSGNFQRTHLAVWPGGCAVSRATGGQARRRP